MHKVLNLVLQHAIAYVEGDSYYGAKAIMNVWNPSIQVPNEFSLSQIWVLAGSFEGDLNSIEAGWQVSSILFGRKLIYSLPFKLKGECVCFCEN